MKKFKVYDYWISIILIISSVIATLIWTIDLSFAGYFVGGGWQLISMSIHQYNNWFTERGRRRRFYHTLIFWLLVSLLAGIIVSPILVMLLYLLLIIAPVMAIYYTTICYREVSQMMQRPLAQLK